MLNKIRSIFTASGPRPQDDVDSLQAEAARIRAEWGGKKPETVDVSAYASPHTAIVAQGLMIQRQAQMNQMQSQQLAQAQIQQAILNQQAQGLGVYATTMFGGGGASASIGNGTGGYGGAGHLAQQIGGGGGASYSLGAPLTATSIIGLSNPPDKFDPVWRVQYEAAREEAAMARVVEEG